MSNIKINNMLKLIAVLFLSFISSTVFSSDIEKLPLNPFCQNHIKATSLALNDKVINVEIACSDTQRQIGLMNRKNLEANSGMLFIFDNTQTLSFWMKDTLIDLSIAYLDKDWNIIEIREMKANDLTSIVSSKPAIFALEANSMWFSKNDIKVGDKVKMATKKTN